MTSFTLPDGNAITINTHARFTLNTRIDRGAGTLSGYSAKFYTSSDATKDAQDVEVSLVSGWGTQSGLLSGVSKTVNNVISYY